MRRLVMATVVYVMLSAMALGVFGLAVIASADDCIHYQMCGPTYNTCCTKGCTYDGFGYYYVVSCYEMIGLGGIKYACYKRVADAINPSCPTPPHLCTDTHYDQVLGPCSEDYD